MFHSNNYLWGIYYAFLFVHKFDPASKVIRFWRIQDLAAKHDSGTFFFKPNDRSGNICVKRYLSDGISGVALFVHDDGHGDGILLTSLLEKNGRPDMLTRAFLRSNYGTGWGDELKHEKLLESMFQKFKQRRQTSKGTQALDDLTMRVDKLEIKKHWK